MKAGEPVAYRTTKEGALAWVDGITLSAKAENIDEAYELINYEKRFLLKLGSPDH